MKIHLALALTLTCVSAAAGPIDIPSDVSVGLTAVPSDYSLPGQTIVFTITAINHGPEPVTALLLISSDFIDEFDLSGGSPDCEGLGLLVSDGETFHYNYVWFPTDVGVFAVGETRICRINLPITANAPAVLPFSFGFPGFVTDLDASNKTATVYLRRAAAASTPVPTLSSMLLLLLAALLGAIGGVAVARYRKP